MKKFITMIVLALGVTISTQAQKKNKEDKTPLTVAQKTTLAVKKMTLKLDLTDKQIKQVTPLIQKQVAERKAMHDARKALKESGKKPSADERFEHANKKLDSKIAFKSKMKQILNEEQFAKFEKMAAHKRGKHGKKGKKGMKDGECAKTSCEEKK